VVENRLGTQHVLNEVCKACDEVVSPYIQQQCIGEFLASLVPVPVPVPAFMLIAWLSLRVVGDPADPHCTLGSFRGIRISRAGGDADLGLTRARKSRVGDNYTLKRVE
jgi:hypothetical protein